MNIFAKYISIVLSIVVLVVSILYLVMILRMIIETNDNEDFAESVKHIEAESAAKAEIKQLLANNESNPLIRMEIILSQDDFDKLLLEKDITPKEEDNNGNR